MVSWYHGIKAYTLNARSELTVISGLTALVEDEILVDHIRTTESICTVC
jgi:hypothetical protein